ncbi:MAG: hypothetical protein R2754_04290 [Microthrixaceae bacterium]
MERITEDPPVGDPSEGGDDLIVAEIVPDAVGTWFISVEDGTSMFLDLDQQVLRVAHEDDPDMEHFELESVLAWPAVGEPLALEVVEFGGTDVLVLEGGCIDLIIRVPEELLVAGDLLEAAQELCETPPRNAWLLVGDSASMPDDEDLAAQRAAIEGGPWVWTCPKHIQPGDLVFVYFVEPEKAVRFVARALTWAEFDPTRGVNSIKKVDPHQWWTFLSPFVPVDSISFKQLEEHFGHKLILRGKPTHYVPPRAFDRIVDGLGELDDEQALILQRPVGNDELPPAGEIGLAELTEMAAGALNTESMVEEYVVEPLLGLAFPASDGFRITRQHRLESGRIPDFAVFNGDELRGLVEAKLGIGRGSGPLAGCPEVEQIRRYCQEAGLPGLLIDANEIVLVSPDEDEPVGYLDRVSLGDAGITEIAGFLAATR